MAAPIPTVPAREDPNALITLVASAATAVLVLTGREAFDEFSAQPTAFASFLALTLALQSVHTVRELNNPTKGEWRISFTGTGSFEGTIEVVGIVEYTKSI